MSDDEYVTEGTILARKYRNLIDRRSAEGQGTPLTDAETIRLIKMILYSPNQPKAIVRGIQAIIEKD